MKRRELLALSLAGPLVRWAREFSPLPARVRVFADLAHTGRLAAVPPTLTPREFGIAVPLPTYLADRDVLPARDPDVQEIAPRLGLLRLESADATGIRVSASGEGAGSVRLFQQTGGEWRRVALEGAATWTLKPDGRGTIEIGVGVFLPEANAEAPQPAWPRSLTLDIAGAQPVPMRVAPFIIPCALERAEEALIVSRTSTADAVKDFREWGVRAGVRTYQLEAQDPCDQWMQDTMEPGVFTAPAPGGVLQANAILSGQRRDFGAAAGGLDRQIAEKLRERGVVTVKQSEPRPRTRWIDWFGNLEVSPPHTDRGGRRYPYGRVITGTQRELSMHPDALRFLEAQGVQWPPIILDTGWLTIGHVDEVINFVPARSALGWKLLLPSPKAARAVLEKLDGDGHGALAVFAGTRDETTVAQLRTGAAASEESTTIDATVARIRAQLVQELNIGDADVAMVPCLFVRGRALIPNAVNCLAVNGHLVATQPKGPVVGGKDAFEDAIRASLAGCTVDMTFIDAWRAYHQSAGEVHCGTNTFRRLSDPAWWNHT